MCGRLYDLFNTRLIINTKLRYIRILLIRKYIYVLFLAEKFAFIKCNPYFWRNNFKPYFLINRQKNEAEYMFLLDALGD